MSPEISTFLGHRALDVSEYSPTVGARSIAPCRRSLLHDRTTLAFCDDMDSVAIELGPQL
jgi:hypothetical protein